MHKLLLLASTILTLVAPAASHAQAGGVEARAPQDRGFDDYDPSVELERRQFLEQELGVNPVSYTHLTLPTIYSV